MAWFVAVAIVVISLLFFAGLRKVAIGILLTVLVGGYSLYQYNVYKDEQSQARIPASQIVVENVSVRPTYGASYDIVGKVTNNSSTYRLDGLSFEVILRDCKGASEQKSNCTMIGEATTHVAVIVPPQETRSFTGSLYFGSSAAPAKGTLQWDYEVAAVTAKRQ